MKFQKSMNSYVVAKYGVYLSILTIFSLVPYLGYITIGPIALTMIPILVGIMAFDLGKTGALIGAVSFGLLSFIAALYMPGATLLFTQFDMAVIPRALIAVPLIGLTCITFKKNKLWQLIRFLLFTLFAYVFNTIFVTVYIFLRISINYPPLGIKSISFHAWVIIIWVQALFEWSTGIWLGAIIFPAVYMTNQKYNKLERY